MILPGDLLGCAERIARTAPADDALNRAVTSRAYYAAYHAARMFHAGLATPGRVGTANGVHEQLIAQLSNPGLSANNPRHDLSKTLGRLMRGFVAMRVDADYHLDRPCSKGSEALELARQILRSVNNGSVSTP